MLTALIMAGGKGTRFWPVSTEEKPKQFISLINEKTMIQETVSRLLALIDFDHIFICTGQKYLKLVQEQLPNIPKRNIIVEPEGRNTAPCILLSSLYIQQIYHDASIVVLPSDHQINNNDEFINVLKDAYQFIRKEKDGIITIGITPNRPETGYGYINFLETTMKINTHDVKKVNCFVEKPDYKTALKYLTDGRYLWNAGMFMFNALFMIDEYKKYANDTYLKLTSLPSIDNSEYFNKLKMIYKECESISVDFAIMEKTKHLFVIPADFGWDDIGNWKALERYIKSDRNNNHCKGNVKLLNSKNNVVFSSDKKVILLDADNLFVVETSECVIVGNVNSLATIHELRGK